METSVNYIVRTTTAEDHQYIHEITREMAFSASERKVSKGSRTPEFIKQKIDAGLAVIAINPQNGDWMGFSYIEVWQHQKYVAHSGLIVAPKYRGMGISKKIKTELFKQCRAQFPQAKLLSLTTNPAVIHVNENLGYHPVSYHQMMEDRLFLEGGNSWIDYKELMEDKTADHKYVAMVFEP